jgi:Ca2+-binding EF-hand superfamily protein
LHPIAILLLLQIFCMLDTTHEGTVTLDNIFDKLVKEERNCFANAIFELVDPEDKEKLEFGEFVQGICTFCCLSPPDMLRFAFSVHDKDKSGMMEMEELHAFIKVLHSTQKSNVSDALSNLNLDQFGRLHFEGFQQMNKQYPAVMYPVFRLQQSVMRATMGISWWNTKVTKLDYWRQNRASIERKQQEKIERMREKQLAQQIRKAMGWRDYYLNKEKRQMFIDSMKNGMEDSSRPATPKSSSNPASPSAGAQGD